MTAFATDKRRGRSTQRHSAKIPLIQQPLAPCTSMIAASQICTQEEIRVLNLCAVTRLHEICNEASEHPTVEFSGHVLAYTH